MPQASSDDVEAADLSEHIQIPLRDGEEAPHGPVGPTFLGRGIREPFVHDRPRRPVQRDLGGSDIGHPIMLGVGKVSAWPSDCPWRSRRGAEPDTRAR